MQQSMPDPPVAAREISVTGRVQGVGFRPFVYRVALRLGLCGSVVNLSGSVLIRVEGPADAIARFEVALIAEAPPLARPRVASSAECASSGAQGFLIEESGASGIADIHLPPDLFCCPDCIAEMQTPSQRRYRYPFTNCTQCGPRYTIIRSLPYDRGNTSMAGFPICAACRAEYDDPRDRRFHAQPLACPDCGPRLGFSRAGKEICRGEPAMAATIECLRDGGIVAVKGIGGYHLICDAMNDATVRRLRTLKHRPHKPLAVMFPARGDDGLDALRGHVSLDPVEARACLDSARPIVLTRRHPDSGLSPAIAPDLAELGVYLPYSPLHHLLLGDFGAPLVMTSGNISGEPVITENDDAERRLSAVADAFLHHDRPIIRAADDSVVRVIAGSPRVIRAGRGLAPQEFDLALPVPEPVIATGGHLKTAVALAWGRRAVVSPHIGDLDSPRSRAIFAQVIADLQALHRVDARRMLCDMNPDYASSRWARSTGLPVTAIPHHMAHASALAGEHPEIARWLIFAWDGAGLGNDGSLWGGEAFTGNAGAWQHAASLRPFHLLGGDRAARGPLLLESIAKPGCDPVELPLVEDADGVLRADWAPLLAVLTDDRLSAATRSGIFHESLARMAVSQACALRRKVAYDAVGLTGGVFQNKLLSERIASLLAARGIQVLRNREVPANDGGLAVGQIIEYIHAQDATEGHQRAGAT